MSKLIIVCGIMGCGKTTFAKEFAEKFDYEYIDFDLEYHTKIQKELLIKMNLPQDIAKLLENLSNLLNNNPYKNFICDNWFKFHKDWWKDEEDDSLQQLKEKLKFHDIKLFYISVPFEKAYEGYIKKGKIPYLIQFENYKNTMKERQKNLLKKISKWETQ